jgi:hypothetical protein
MAKSQRLGIYDILVLHQEWNTELVAQFYATTWRSGEGFDSTLNFALEGHRFELKIMELPIIFAFAEMTLIERQSAPRELYRIMSWHLSTILRTSSTLAPIMVCFLSTTSSTTSLGTHSHPSEVIALESVARQGTSY